MLNTISQKNSADGSRLRKRMALIRLGICFLLLTLLIKIAYIKIVNGDIFEKYAIIHMLNGSDNTERVLKPVRGFVYDRNNHELAVSQTVYNIILDVKVLNSLEAPEEKEKILNITAALLGRDPNDLRQIADDPRNANSNYVKIALGISYDKWSEIKQCIDDGVYYEVFTGQMTEKEAGDAKLKRFYLNCVHEEMDTYREYPRETFAAQVIGFIRENDDIFGLEKSYNADLSGKPGRQFRAYSAEGYPETDETPAVPGHTLVTTLDVNIQDFAQEATDKALTEYAAQRAAMIVMDPNKGEVLAMAQSPSFNSNKANNIDFFTDSWLKSSWDLMTDEQKSDALYEHWINFNVSTPFEPGSIFKPIVVAAALEEGVISPDETFYCSGHKTVSGREISCWIAESGGAHGTQTLTQAVANSCNVALMEIAEKMGRDLFYKYRGDFGYGEKTGIDLPGENAVSDPWLMFSLDQLNPVELATSSFGQGFSSTAIQAITSFSAVINGGYLVKPYVVSQIRDYNGNVLEEFKPSLVRRVISEDTSNKLRVMLNAVVSPEGTGRNAVIEGYNIGGKTGTGQQISNKSYEEGELMLSFIAFLPVENPRYIALALIDRPRESTEGSASAAPMLREVLEKIIKYKNIPPSEEVNAADIDDGSMPMPNYTEASLMDATQSLNSLGLDYSCAGEGDIVKSQFPTADARVTPGSEIILYLRSSGAELAVVPDVTGLRPEDALTAVYGAELSAAVVYTSDDGGWEMTADATPVPAITSADRSVYKQMPEPGQKVQKGAELKLKVS
ncbi:MAG: PASTA domain-containing protein [Clostridiales bacterium]|jgi:stage V sporulation protein D (sporulation-specific penicillin-binding protein)|nr:PASTA domain-containing protein [Clostridiales bacterium]